MVTYIQIGYDLVISEVEEGSKVLDLGCGDGALLRQLEMKKKIQGFGVEISSDGVSKCVEKGLYCYQGDIDEGLSDYKENAFDYVILNQTLQSTKKPQYVLKEIMRISKNAIITFPNFGFIKTRMQLLVSGKMPKHVLLPYEWYESPDIHHLTIKDFQNFCKKHKYKIRKEKHFDIKRNGKSDTIHLLPNLTAQYGFFILDGINHQNNNNVVNS